MRFIQKDTCEFRRVRIQEKDGKKNFYYSFEDDFSAFELYSREDLTSKLTKGSNYHLILESFLWDHKISYNLKDVEPVK